MSDASVAPSPTIRIPWLHAAQVKHQRRIMLRGLLGWHDLAHEKRRAHRALAQLRATREAARAASAAARGPIWRPTGAVVQPASGAEVAAAAAKAADATGRGSSGRSHRRSSNDMSAAERAAGLSHFAIPAPLIGHSNPGADGTPSQQLRSAYFEEAPAPTARSSARPKGGQQPVVGTPLRRPAATAYSNWALLNRAFSAWFEIAAWGRQMMKAQGSNKQVRMLCIRCSGCHAVSIKYNYERRVLMCGAHLGICSNNLMSL